MDDKRRKKNENRKIIYGISLITQVGLSMMVPIFICVAIAIIISDKTGFDAAVPIAILIGVMTAFRNVYMLTKKMYSKDYDRENKELQYFADLKKERESKLQEEKKK